MKKLIIALLANVFAVNMASANVWINEIHYDNTGGDTGEFFEIAGAAGTDLSDYFIELINGSNGAVYNTVNLNGTIDNESNGFGAVSFYESGIQNGSPDGIALYSTSGNTLIQFLSYEGSFQATSGNANGVTSIDIGVSEPGSTPVGQSLQLIGTGNQFSDFTFTGPLTNSAGSLNAGQMITMTTAVPEPETYAMFLAGLGLLAFASRRKA